MNRPCLSSVALFFLQEVSYHGHMCEDPTKDIGEKHQTNPTLDTVVQMLSELRQHMDKRFDALEIRIDRMESVIHETK